MNGLNDKSLKIKIKQLKYLRILTTKIDESMKKNIRYIDKKGNYQIVNQYKMDQFNLLPEEINMAVNKIFSDLSERMTWSGCSNFKIDNIEFVRVSLKSGYVSEEIYVSKNIYKDQKNEDRNISLIILSGGQGIGLASFDLYAMRPSNHKRRQKITLAI